MIALAVPSPSLVLCEAAMNHLRKDSNSNKKIWIFVFVIVSVFCVIFFAARGRFVVDFSSPAVVTALAPFQRALSWASGKTENGVEFIWDVANVYKQNEMLRNEVSQLRQQNLKAEEYYSENIRLRDLLNYKNSSTQFDLLAAQVIGREMDYWTSMIIVNRGSVEGVSTNMPVVTSEGLVGRVVEVTPNAAKVQLILDPRSSVGSLVQRSDSRVVGIVQGNMENAMVPHMANIPRNSNVAEGDVIVTSGFGGIYPKGIMIGTVMGVQSDRGGLLDVVSINPSVDFQKLEDVMIITVSREAPPEHLVPPQQTPGTENDANGQPVNNGAGR